MSDLRARRCSLRSALALVAAGLLTAAPAVADDNVERVEPVLGYAPIPADESVAVSGTAVDFASPAPAVAPQAEPEEEQVAELIAEGEASYYGNEFRGRRTANGERYNPHGLTAAHRKLPMGSKLRVTNVRNGRSVLVRVNDRGPFHGRRIIDMSYAAAEKLGMIRAGKALVKVELLR